MRDKLKELINQVRDKEISLTDYEINILIDHLINNSVLVSPDHQELFWTAESMFDHWNETTGAIVPDTSWYYELLSIIKDIVELSFGAGILYKEKTEKVLKEHVVK